MIRGWFGQASGDELPRHLVAWSVGIALLFAILGLGELVEDGLRLARNQLVPQRASQQVVVVRYDEDAVARFGLRPSGQDVAAMIDGARAAGAPVLMFDFRLAPGRSAVEREALRAAVARHGGVGMGVMVRLGRGGDTVEGGLSTAREIGAEPVDLSVPFNYASIAWQAPYASIAGRQHYRSLAAATAGRRPTDDSLFPIDWSINPASLPTISVTDLVDGRVPRGALAGKRLILGPYSAAMADVVYSPGYGRIPGVLMHALAAETLAKGNPRALGPAAPLLLALIALLAVLRGLTRRRARALAMIAALLPVLAFPLDRQLLFVDVVPGMSLLLVAAGMIVWRRHRLRGLTDALTGRPNLAALRAAPDQRDQPLVACRIANYTQILSTLRGDDEATLVRQLLKRLALGAGDQRIHVGDDGLFAWFADAPGQVVSRVEAIQSLFRGPISVDTRNFDVVVAFGIEIGSGASNATRLGRALAAADDAAREGLKYLVHNPERLEDTSWRLSLLSQLDKAISNGELWVAYQPQIDLASGRIVGAEALARWTHPDKGPIAPSEFIAAAEQGDRIDKLTDFVLDHAVATAAQALRDGHPFDVAVNLSARLLSDRKLPLKVAATLSRHGLPAERLTLELTETAAVAGSHELALLNRLRDLGVTISIDDYGTGLSTLEYLKTVPAGELKIDQSFIRAMADNRSDRMLVQSTISLAHALERTVVAEGVESQALLDLLVQMGCDRAQGYHIGRPASAKTLHRRLKENARRRVA